MQVAGSASRRVELPRVVLFRGRSTAACPHSGRVSSTSLGLVPSPPVERVTCVQSVVSVALVRGVAERSVAFVLRARPKSVLAPALLASRQAVSATKCRRIAERLSQLAAGEPGSRFNDSFRVERELLAAVGRRGRWSAEQAQLSAGRRAIWVAQA